MAEEQQVFGADHLTKIGFSPEQAAQWQGEWTNAVDTIVEHGSRLGAAIILSPIGSAVIHGGSDVLNRVGRLLDPRRAGSVGGLDNLLGIFGLSPDRTPPPPDAALMYAAADFGHTVGYLLPLAVTGVALYQNRDFFRGALNAISLAWERHQVGVIKKAETGRPIVVTQEMQNVLLDFQQQLSEQAGTRVLSSGGQ